MVIERLQGAAGFESSFRGQRSSDVDVGMAAGPITERNQGLSNFPTVLAGMKDFSPTWWLFAVLDATIYVGGLDDKISESLLWELFVQAGPVGT